MPRPSTTQRPPGTSHARARKIGLHPRETGPRDGLGQRRIGARRLVRLDQLREQPQADHEIFLAGENARRIEEGFEPLLALMEPGQAPRKIRDVHRRGGDAPVDGDVEHMRALRDHLRQTRRSAENIGEELQHRLMRLQQREQLRRRRHARQRGVESRHAGIGVAGFGKRFEQGRNEFGQHLAGAGAAHRGAASEMPAAHGFGGQRRVAKAHVAQGLQRFGIVGRAGKDQIARAGVEARRMFEQARVMFLDGVEMAQQIA